MFLFTPKDKSYDNVSKLFAVATCFHYKTAPICHLKYFPKVFVGTYFSNNALLIPCCFMDSLLFQCATRIVTTSLVDDASELLI